MTSRIQSYSPQGTDAAAPPPVQTAKPATAAASPQTAQTDSVTLSEAAQTGTALLTAARTSSGIDQTNVTAIRQALANGTYNVSPETLAQAISTVLNETGS
ncbi:MULTISPECIES: flagellar biosynthesis anti-sigma factor FlgM [Acidocella]|uniref:flagellar biosynthesis anti-sigma factor FlgM n=1 Tax=Acidocella TaxID=50709 RepID=UPI00028D539D|nr:MULTISPECIES: flagellar biosynthesis anti-sigma factor FlgM [Acidocella]EKM99681.1 anti-sigma-28 factor FlgM [Acidocella sp. MX-AZ02]WBO58299.1 flagellar biosynthesis anti-sigma factor FlgM [Acidocella sp. MX-AZ03]